jgi:hypothetical protein
VEANGSIAMKNESRKIIVRGKAVSVFSITIPPFPTMPFTPAFFV